MMNDDALSNHDGRTRAEPSDPAVPTTGPPDQNIVETSNQNITPTQNASRHPDQTPIPNGAQRATPLLPQQDSSRTDPPPPIPSTPLRISTTTVQSTPRTIPLNAPPAVPTTPRFSNHAPAPFTSPLLTADNLSLLSPLTNTSTQPTTTFSPHMTASSRSTPPEEDFDAIPPEEWECMSLHERLAHNGVLDRKKSRAPDNLRERKLQLDVALDHALPEMEYETYVREVETLCDRMELFLAADKLLDTPRGLDYRRQPSLAFTALPPGLGFNNGLQTPNADFVEGLTMEAFPTFSMYRMEQSIMVHKEGGKAVILPHLAGILRLESDSRQEAMARSAYAGAALVYVRSRALALLGIPDRSNQAVISTFITDGTTVEVFAHYAVPAPESGKMVYHQYSIASSGLTSSVEDLEKGRRMLKNLQRYSRQKALELSALVLERMRQRRRANHGRQPNHGHRTSVGGSTVIGSPHLGNAGAAPGNGQGTTREAPQGQPQVTPDHQTFQGGPQDSPPVANGWDPQENGRLNNGAGGDALLADVQAVQDVPPEQPEQEQAPRQVDQPQLTDQPQLPEQTPRQLEQPPQQPEQPPQLLEPLPQQPEQPAQHGSDQLEHHSQEQPSVQAGLPPHQPESSQHRVYHPEQPPQQRPQPSQQPNRRSSWLPDRQSQYQEERQPQQQLRRQTIQPLAPSNPQPDHQPRSQGNAPENPKAKQQLGIRRANPGHPRTKSHGTAGPFSPAHYPFMQGLGLKIPAEAMAPPPPAASQGLPVHGPNPFSGPVPAPPRSALPKLAPRPSARARPAPLALEPVAAADAARMPPPRADRGPGAEGADAVAGAAARPSAETSPTDAGIASAANDPGEPAVFAGAGRAAAAAAAAPPGPPCGAPAEEPGAPRGGAGGGGGGGSGGAEGAGPVAAVADVDGTAAAVAGAADGRGDSGDVHGAGARCGAAAPAAGDAAAGAPGFARRRVRREHRGGHQRLQCGECAGQ